MALYIYVCVCVCVCVSIYIYIYIYIYISQAWNSGMLRNTEAMQMLVCQENNTHTCLTPMTFPLMSSISPYLPSQSSYLMPTPLQPLFSQHRMLKTPACKRAMPLPLSECYSDGQGSLSGLLSLIKTCCL
jgi:hypothetical protein